MVSVTNKTVDVMSIFPYKKLINKFINEKLDNDSTIVGSQVDANTNATVNIPETIGDSVILDANNPNDMYDIDNNKNPNIDVKYVGTSGIW